MKVKITEIECNADELRQSNTLSDGVLNVLRNCFNPRYSDFNSQDDDESEDENNE